MATLLEMAAEIVASHASTTSMSKDELLTALSDVHKTLAALERGEVTETSDSEQAPVAKISLKKAFGKDKIICLLCQKEMKTLTRHLKTFHNMKPSEYRKQFGIPRTQALAAKSYSESRKEMAIARGLGEKLVNARAIKAAKATKVAKAVGNASKMEKAAATVKPAKIPKTVKK